MTSVSYRGPTSPEPVAVPGGDVYAPTGIDATGATDVTAALQAWIDGVPDGTEGSPSILRFPAGSTYRLDGSLYIDGRNHLRFDCPSGTKPIFDGGVSHGGFPLRNPGESCSAYNTRCGIDTSPEVVAVRTRVGWSIDGDSDDIAFSRLAYKGGNPTWSNDTGDCMEACAAWEIKKCTRTEFDHCEARETWGDAFSIQGGVGGPGVHVPAIGTWIHDCTTANIGRINLLINNCQNTLFENNTVGRCHSGVLHAEPNFADSVSEHTWIQDNTFTATGSIQLNAEGGSLSALTNNIYMLRNTAPSGSFGATVGNAGNDEAHRRHDFYFVENSSAAIVSAPQRLTFDSVDYVYVRDNDAVVQNTRAWITLNRTCAYDVATNSGVHHLDGSTTGMINAVLACNRSPAPTPTPTGVPSPPAVWPFA